MTILRKLSILISYGLSSLGALCRPCRSRPLPTGRHTNSIQPQLTTRHIRVFISSTFRDMQKERDILIKKIFPQLRKLCEERAVMLTEVDLRWGITDEQKAEGKVLPLCLEEIHRCRPYFIGVLGERYGWVPDSIPVELLESQPWLKQQLRNSVTELEIMHGVFQNRAMHRHAYFYFRDPRYVDNIAVNQRADFIEENTKAVEKLRKLKQKIRRARDAQACVLREDYANPEQLGEWVLEDFTSLINTLYPITQVPDELDQESARHEAYVHSRRLGFIGREDLLGCLNEHVSAGNTPLVLVGDSGCGKSALLAEWLARWREDHPGSLAIQHYIGSTPDSADWQRLVRRILGELKRTFTITEDIPLQSDGLCGTLNDWMGRVPGSCPVVLILDALNQLAEYGTGRQLDWLPVVFPANFSVLVSSLPGESLRVLHKRGWPELNVPLLRPADIAPVTRAYFKVFSKTPPPEIISKLESVPTACNVLYLRAVLDELRQFGKYEELQAKAAHYLSAYDLPNLFDRILERWENDFGTDLVCQSLSLIWAARRGLSETEILDLLGKEPTCDLFKAHSERSVPEMLRLLNEIRKPCQPMPRAKWMPFFLACEAGFAVCAGLLTFSHVYLRDAVEKRYLPTPDAKRAAHERLVLYFETLPLPAKIGSDGSPNFNEQAAAVSRALDEEPWQLQAACRWKALAEHLSFLPVFRVACATGREFEWMQYWQRIVSAVEEGTAPPMDIPGLYLAGFRQLSPEQKILVGETLGQFLWSLGCLDAADECFEEIGNADVFANDSFLRAGNLNDKGLIERDRGRVREALTIFEQAERMLEDSGAFKGGSRYAKDARRLLASILMNKASAIRDVADRSQCRPLFDRALALMAEATGDRSPEVATVLQSMGNLAFAEEDFKEALSLQQQAHVIRREKLGPNHRDVGLSLGNTANALARMEYYHYAISLWERSLEILKRTVGEDHGFSLSVCKSLHQCESVTRQAITKKSGFGVILLAFDSLPPTENPPDPTTSEGAHIVAQGVRDNLISIWDDAFAHQSSVPVLVVSCPGYEDAVSLASEECISKRYRGNLLTWLKIPDLSKDFESPTALISLVSVRRQFLDWLQEHAVDVVMIRPITEVGATFDRWLLESVRRGQEKDAQDSLGTLSPGSRNLNQDHRPIAIEVVSFDGLDGPLFGLYTGNHDPRPCIMPSIEWRQQGYSPQSGDERATGVFYLNLPEVRQWLNSNTEKCLSPLDEWSMDPLMAIATKPREEQLHVFEAALSGLMLLVKTSPIRCPAERGRRGFLENGLNREVEDMLT